MFKRSTRFAVAVFSIAAIGNVGDNAYGQQNSIPQTANTRDTIVCDRRGCLDHGHSAKTRRAVAPARTAVQPAIAADANGNVIIGSRPSGCPHAFCGCEASRYVFGEIRPELNLASNWIVKFPRASAAPGMVAARNHHVMVLMHHVDGDKWFAHDGNSGSGLTREHVVSIKGYVIVDPHAARAAQAN